jgi:hypothetical protein
MQFRLRLLAWALTAALEQLLLLTVGVLGAIAVVGVVAALLGSLAVRALLPSMDRRVDAAWAEIVAPLSTFPDQAPPVTLNQTAARIETVAALMGIGVAPSSLPDRTQPSRESSQAFASVSDQLVDICRFEAVGGEQYEFYLPWREGHRTRIAELIGVIVGGELPRWDHDLDQSPEGPACELGGLLWLHRLLTAEAWLTAAEGDAAGANRALEASWRLSEGLRASPQLEVHELTLDALELQSAALRRIPQANHEWQNRLRSVDPPSQARRAYLCESWLVRRRAETVSERQPVIGFVAQPFARLLAIDNHEAMLQAVSDLEGTDINGFDSARFAAEQFSRVPRWNSLARSGLMSSWDSWHRSVRSGLLAEMTRRVLRIRELYDEGAWSALQELQAAQPSRMTGLDWRYLVEAPDVTIGLEPDPFSSGFPFPLSETVSFVEPQPNEG